MRCALAVVGSFALLTTIGCAMCASPYDGSYAAFGGRVQRSNRSSGRVGSIFDPSAGVLREAEGASIVVPSPADEQISDGWGALGPAWGEPLEAGDDLPLDFPSEESVPWQPSRETPRTAVPLESLPALPETDLGTPLPDMDVEPGDF